MAADLESTRPDDGAGKAPPAKGEEAADGPWRIGGVVSGRYVVERRLGAGAMGVVFLAFDRLLRKKVALKALRPDLARNPKVVARFHREVALAQSVTHPNVVRIFDTGEAAGMPYFTMEYLTGQQLDRTIQEGKHDPHAALTIREIRDIALDVLQAMAAAHAAGVIHRDLKPSNVMLTHRGAIVMDFGVAGIEDSDDVTGRRMGVRFDSLVHTEAGTIFGSPAYMAPELWDGAPASVQSDLYAFGVMVYQMLTGTLPYDARSPTAFLEKLHSHTPPPVRSLRKDTPWPLAVLVKRCMAKVPDRRPPSAAAAARIISPLRARTRRQLAALLAAGAALALLAYAVLRAPPYAEEGVTDPAAHADLAAAVRAFDAGDAGAALRHLDRVDARSPGSAAARFVRALVHFDAGDETGRRRACAGPPPERGRAVYRTMAADACQDPFRLAPALLALVSEEPGAAPEPFLPLAVRWSLVERLEGAGPATRDRALRVSRRALDRLARPPDWDGWWITPALWKLARVDLLIARGEIDRARTALSAVALEHPKDPRVLAKQAWLAELSGQDSLVRELAASLAPLDPTPSIRRMLARGRLAAAWKAIAAAPPIHRAALRSMWCGYTFRYEFDEVPERCRDLPHGLVRGLWGLDGAARLARHLSPHEATLLRQQAALDRGACRPTYDDKAPLLVHTAAPFELYAAQVEVAHALCAHAPERADVTRARRVVSTLSELSPQDPWIRLLAARVAERLGDAERAEALRRAVLDDWRDADPDLPLVARLRRHLHAFTPARPVVGRPAATGGAPAGGPR